MHTYWVYFHDEATGANVKPDKFYGFGDAGSLAGSFDGYDTREAAVEAIRKEYPESSIGTKPNELGEVGVCVLSGREYVTRLGEIEDINLWGSFYHDT